MGMPLLLCARDQIERGQCDRAQGEMKRKINFQLCAASNVNARIGRPSDAEIESSLQHELPESTVARKPSAFDMSMTTFPPLMLTCTWARQWQCLSRSPR